MFYNVIKILRGSCFMKEKAKKKSGFIKEFKEFAMKGSVIDLAVGVIIGGAFQTIVKSLVDDLINPIIGMLFKSDFSSLYIPLFKNYEGFIKGMSLEQVKELGAPVFAYGNFISNVINFIIMAFVIFLLVKTLNKLSNIGRKKEEPTEAPAPTTKNCPFCCSEIAIDATRCPHCTSELPIKE